ncbi:flagellar basal body-associated FliL family protein [Tepidiforma flava]|uniref:Flagellar protein FliL n=1 Tax=Tepidiforma flava TaxID=3004094 RepID=A0ABY7MC74_9CHLR|nr:flagellar basal body-associated FliL family protein [Tepidiforma flava]WBL37540.1 flagellar basal body-associated FliL family protein [Tepidiforma flava]
MVLNLKPSGTTQRYVKVIMALEFGPADNLLWVGLTTDQIAAKNAEFVPITSSPKCIKILDAIANVIGSHTAEEVATVEGKEKLKEELIEAINHHLHGEKVEKIYFETFIVQ